MYNIKAQSINHFSTLRIEGEEEDAAMATFVRNCLKAFKKTIQPTVEHFADCPTSCTQISFVSNDTSSTSSSPDGTEEEVEGMIDNESIMVLPKAVLSTLQGKPFAGTHYAFLMTHPLYGKKTSANIGYSTNPMYDVHLHNTYAINDRTTSAAAPHWILDIVLGPFISAEIAIECTKEWVSNTRGKKSKRAKAVLLSRAYNVPLYSVAIKPILSLREYLAMNAPPNYMECYEKMISSLDNPYHQQLQQQAFQRGGNKRQKKKIACSITHVSQ